MRTFIAPSAIEGGLSDAKFRGFQALGLADESVWAGEIRNPLPRFERAARTLRGALLLEQNLALSGDLDLPRLTVPIGVDLAFDLDLAVLVAQLELPPGVRRAVLATSGAPDVPILRADGQRRRRREKQDEEKDSLGKLDFDHRDRATQLSFERTG